jgi:hypothetical protein
MSKLLLMPLARPAEMEIKGSYGSAGLLALGLMEVM